MKIIKQGKLNKVEKCNYCECEFEYDVEDIKEEFDYGFVCLSNATKQRFVKCPECGNKIKIRLQGD